MFFDIENYISIIMILFVFLENKSRENKEFRK